MVKRRLRRALQRIFTGAEPWLRCLHAVFGSVMEWNAMHFDSIAARPCCLPPVGGPAARRRSGGLYVHVHPTICLNRASNQPQCPVRSRRYMYAREGPVRREGDRCHRPQRRKSSPPVSTRRRRPRIDAASACGLQSSPGRDVSASRASSARSLLRMQIMVQRRQRHLNILQLCSSGPARAASARHGSHMRTRATTACRRPEERASSFYVRLEISATTSATTTRVRDAILPAQEEG